MIDSISIIIPTFNRARFLSRAINSALYQIKENDEIIIIDDGSTDNTEKLIKKYNSKQIKYIKTKNNGAGSARNRGVAESTKSLIAFIDSDDEWMPEKLNLQRSFMLNVPDILFCFSNFSFWNKKGTEDNFSLKTWHSDNRSWPEILGPGKPYSSYVKLFNNDIDFMVYTGYLFPSSFSFHYLNINTLLVRRIHAGHALRFAEDTKTYEEWECLLRLSCIGKCAYFDSETVWQHAHSGPRLTDASGLDIVSSKIKILERLWASNKAFLFKHEETFQNILNEQRLFKIGILILSGNSKAAKKEISQLPSCPFIYRFLSLFPGHISKTLALFLRMVRKLAR